MKFSAIKCILEKTVYLLKVTKSYCCKLSSLWSKLLFETTATCIGNMLRISQPGIVLLSFSPSLYARCAALFIIRFNLLKKRLLMRYISICFKNFGTYGYKIGRIDIWNNLKINIENVSKIKLSRNITSMVSSMLFILKIVLYVKKHCINIFGTLCKF